MDARKQRILRLLVEDYIETAHPVGSRAIARKHGLGVSPATVRNEMADLEEMGMVEQPHTSAGRVPSSRGYRYYVDNLMAVGLPGRVELESVREVYRDRSTPVRVLIRRTADLLSEVTQYTSLVVGPGLERASFRRLEILPVNGNRLLVVLLTGDGTVQTRLLDRPENVSPEYLERMVIVLNSGLSGLDMEVVAGRGLDRLRQDFPRGITVLECLRGMIEAGEAGDDEGLCLGGAANMLRQPEFRDVDKVETLFSILEQGRAIRELLAELSLDPGDVVVTIGEENRYPEMRDCSLVTAACYVGGRLSGRIAILGPRRMRYSRVVGLVATVRELLGQELWRRRMG
ncbi:MAG: heat-inducible transcriptional repressor HrcA [bacterium]|nr:heat-inducible transcriptional repressor HrcA [bacterium]